MRSFRPDLRALSTRLPDTLPMQRIVLATAAPIAMGLRRAGPTMSIGGQALRRVSNRRDAPGGADARPAFRIVGALPQAPFDGVEGRCSAASGGIATARWPRGCSGRQGTHYRVCGNDAARPRRWADISTRRARATGTLRACFGLARRGVSPPRRRTGHPCRQAGDPMAKRCRPRSRFCRRESCPRRDPVRGSRPIAFAQTPSVPGKAREARGGCMKFRA